MRSTRKAPRAPRFVTAAVACLIVLALTPYSAFAKTTTWTHLSGIDDFWSNPGNWSDGVPVVGDEVLFAPIGGPSLMDIPGLGLNSMDMSGFSGTLTLGTDLPIAGFVTVSGTFELASHSLILGGDLNVGGTLDATSANVVVGGSVHVASGSLLMGNGTLELGGDLDLDATSSSSWGAAGMLRFNGSGVQTWSDESGGAGYGHVEVDPPVPGGHVVIPASSPPLTIGGDVSVGSGGAGGALWIESDLIVGGGVLVANGAAVESHAWAPKQPLVTFESFFDLQGTFSATGDGGTLRFAAGGAGTVTVGPAATFEVVGTASDRIRLEQDGVAGGTQWIIDVQPGATTHFENVEVQDSDASPGQTCTATGTSADLGNNTNWTFPPKTTTWTHGGFTDNWSEVPNWDNGVPAFNDTVLFDPIGGPSLMDIPALTLHSMDMTGYSGTLTLGTDLDIAGFVTVSGTFELASHSLDVGGALRVGGTLDVGSAGLSVGDSLLVPGGTLVVHGGLLDLYGPMDGTIGATFEFDSLSTMRVRDHIDLESFTWGTSRAGAVQSYGSKNREFRSGRSSFADLVIDHTSSNVKMTFKGGPIAVRHQFDGMEGELELQVDSLTIAGDANLGLPSGQFLRVTGTGVTLAIAGQTLTGDFAFEASHSTASFHDLSVVRSFVADSVGTSLRFAPGHTLTVGPGASLEVVGGGGGDRSQLRLEGTPLSSQWLLDAQSGSTTHFENVEVQDSDASPGETCTAIGDCVDLGNNTNWNFVITAADNALPLRLSLRAVPNPFNPSTTLHYGVPKNGRVTVRIYDVRGALVRTILDDTRHPGIYTEQWDGTNDARYAVGSGIYFCRIQAGGEGKTLKLVLIK